MEYPPLLLHSLLSVLNIITWPHNCLFSYSTLFFISKLLYQNPSASVHHSEGVGGMSLRQLTDKEARTGKHKMRWKMDRMRKGDISEGGGVEDLKKWKDTGHRGQEQEIQKTG